MFDLYKFNDYEPVRVYETPRILVASRYHWSVLTLWTQPLLSEGKPVVSFFFGTHTPIICSSKKSRMNVLQLKDEPLTVDEDYWLKTVDLPLLKKMKQKSLVREVSRKTGYGDILATEEESTSAVSEKYIFDISRMKIAVIIGPPPKPSDFPTEISTEIWPSEEQGSQS